MQPVPCFDAINEKGILSETELNFLVAVIYLTTVLFICELALAIVNTWAFVIKQKKYKTWPILIFYILAICSSIMRIYGSFWFFYIYTESEIFGYLFNPVLAIDLGVVQCWMLIELGLRI